MRGFSVFIVALALAMGCDLPHGPRRSAELAPDLCPYCASAVHRAVGGDTWYLCGTKRTAASWPFGRVAWDQTWSCYKLQWVLAQSWVDPATGLARVR